MENVNSQSAKIHLSQGKLDVATTARLQVFLSRQGSDSCLSHHPGVLNALAQGLNHTPYLIEAVDGDQTSGMLLLSYVKSALFGRMLVSLPYLNYGGVLAKDAEVGRAIIDRAVSLADELKVKYLELRHVEELQHDQLTEVRRDKVHMRLPLAANEEDLWNQIPGKARNLVRKGQKGNFDVRWGNVEQLADFYTVFCENMRDLGTPVYGKKLFRSFLETFLTQCELCVVYDSKKPVACAMLFHGHGITEVPSASSLRSYNSTAVNMLMYWHLLCRAVQRGQHTFDFGRSSLDSPTFKFKKQWNAEPLPACWQYYLREGSLGDTKKENPKYQKLIAMWRKLPLWVTKIIGPSIVRGIP